jgi:hypothetical protein
MPRRQAPCGALLRPLRPPAPTGSLALSSVLTVACRMGAVLEVVTAPLTAICGLVGEVFGLWDRFSSPPSQPAPPPPVPVYHTQNHHHYSTPGAAPSPAPKVSQLVRVKPESSGA